MVKDPVQRLKALAASDRADERKLYKSIRDRRDAILTRAVSAAASTLLEQSGYRPMPGADPGSNRQQAVKMMADYLAQSSISEIDQRLLALAGSGALAGWVVVPPSSEEVGAPFVPYRSGSGELDPAIVHRLARALYRSPDQAALLQRHIQEGLAGAPTDEAALCATSIETLLAEIPLGELDNTIENMVVEGILGG